MDEFVNRMLERVRLRDMYDSESAELAIVYGRRRLGKTELVKQSLSDREDAVFYQAHQKTKTLQIEQFIDRASEAYPEITDIREDWEALLGYLVRQNAIVVLDEFPSLVEEDSSLPSVLQALYDHSFYGSTTTFVLIGSSICMMEKAAQLESSPLYGRASMKLDVRFEKLDVRQLTFAPAMEFFDQSYTPEEQIVLWGIFGGTPYYLEEAAGAETIGEAVYDLILTQHGPLRNDPDYVLRMELTEPTRYFSILESIAGGTTTRNEIAQASGIHRDQLSRYLSRLERLRIIERHVPLTDQKERSRRGRYRIRDPLFRFWFRFVYGSGTRYDDFGSESFSTLIEPEIPDFISSVFEQLCQRVLRSLYPEQTITDVGQWWYREHEIDVVGFTTEDTLIVGECKFQRSPMGYDALSKLEDHTEELRWNPPNGSDRVCEYALFSRSGFKRSLEEASTERDDIRLFDLDSIVSTLRI